MGNAVGSVVDVGEHRVRVKKILWSGGFSNVYISNVSQVFCPLVVLPKCNRSCLVWSGLVWSGLVLSCLVLSCLVLSCPCPALPFLVRSYLVSSCLVLPLPCLVLPMSFLLSHDRLVLSYCTALRFFTIHPNRMFGTANSMH
jgi:hypothetical protein